jgi:hypothetical protein
MWQTILAAPIIVLLVLAVLPIILIYYIGRLIRGLWLQSRVKLAWPKGKFVLLAYTSNRKWVPFIETQLLPRIGDACVIVDRSHAQWKERFPLEANVISHWGGYREHNPLAVVFPGAGRTRVFRMYKAFQALQRGKHQPLEEVSKQLIDTVEQCRKVS